MALTVLQLGVGAEHTALAQQMGAAAGAGLHDLRTGCQLFLELFQLQECGGLLGFALRGQLDGLGRFGGVEAGSLGGAACGLLSQ